MSDQISRSKGNETTRTVMSWGRRVKVQTSAAFDQEKEKIAAQVLRIKWREWPMNNVLEFIFYWLR